MLKTRVQKVENGFNIFFMDKDFVLFAIQKTTNHQPYFVRAPIWTDFDKGQEAFKKWLTKIKYASSIFNALNSIEDASKIEFQSINYKSAYLQDNMLHLWNLQEIK